MRPFLRMCCILAACAATMPCASAQIAIQSRATVFAYRTADPYDPANEYGFNHAPSVVAMPDGRLLAAWFSGPFEGSVHQVILGSYSSDGGATWSDATVLHDTATMSDFDPAFIRRGESVWMFYASGRWNAYPSIRGDDGRKMVGPESFVIYARRTDDSGDTWSPPQPVFNDTGWGCRSNGIALPTGTMLLPTHAFMAWTSSVLRSTDGGGTWQRSEPVSGPKAAEPAIALLKSGRVLMLVRSRDGTIRRSYSRDEGRTWSALQETGLVAGDASSSVITLHDGTLVLAFNHCKPPHRSPLSVSLSRDEGETWSDPVQVDHIAAPKPGEPSWHREVTYPSMTELGGGEVLLVWTCIDLAPDVQSGEIRAAVLLVHDAP